MNATRRPSGDHEGECPLGAPSEIKDITAPLSRFAIQMVSIVLFLRVNTRYASSADQLASTQLSMAQSINLRGSPEVVSINHRSSPPASLAAE